VREADINIQGDFDIDELIATAERAVSSLPDQDVEVWPSVRGAYYDPRNDWLHLYGDYVDDALLAVTRVIHSEFPHLVLMASDEVGNEVDWASPDTVTPFTYPEPLSDDQSNTVVVDLPAKIIPLIERSASKHGKTVPEEISEWVTEKALSAA
jgi:hypothetical protein